jgi:hypothetical protein
MPYKNLIASNEEQLVSAILEMQELLKKLRAMDIPDKDEFIKAISYAKDVLYGLWKEMGKEN